MLIGKLNKKVLFRFNIPEAKGAGFSDTYFDLLTTKGYLKRNHGSRGLALGEVDVKSNYTLWVRYQSYLESHLRNDLHVVIDGKTYTVGDWELVDEKNFYYKIILNAIES